MAEEHDAHPICEALVSEIEQAGSVESFAPRGMNLLLFWLAAIPLMSSPGPAYLSLASVGTAYGFRRGIPYMMGIVVGTVGVLIFIATGITALILAQPMLVNALTVFALVYILYLAWKIATVPIVTSETKAIRAPSPWSGFVLAIANPKAFAAIGAVYASQVLVENNLLLDSVAKVAALSLLVVLAAIVWLCFGSVFSQLLTKPHIGRAVNRFFALMLLVSVGVSLIGPR